MSTSKTKYSLTERCKDVWEEMRRDWNGVMESPQIYDLEQIKNDTDSQMNDVMTDSSQSSDGIVTDDISDTEPTEPSDINISVLDYHVYIGRLRDSLIQNAADDVKHWNMMDKDLGRILQCSVPSWQEAHPQLLDHTVSILERLPKSSLPLSRSLWSTLCDNNSDYKNQHESTATPDSTLTSYLSLWQSCNVTTMIDTNTVRLALLTAYLEQKTHRGVADAATVYSNTMSDLLDEITALEQASDDISSNRRHRYQVARGFLWTAWQRWIQVSTYYLFGTRLLRRCSPEDWYPALPPEYDELELSTVGNSLKVEDQTEKACNYMCRHSYDLVRLSAPGSLDLRTLVIRYNDQFGNKRARCHQSGADWLHCDAAAAFCKRCVTSTPEDQSAHDQACSNKQCQRLIWDKNSYLSTEAPRAVDISLSDSNSTKCLRYRKAAGQTLAISHVWGHGQGGRPEDGFNECLHNRYSAIALNLGCDSYWIDAACIPSDEHLRSKAIKAICPTFRESKVTLICDRDVMEIDIGSQSLSKEQCERLISVLLLSDWNIRAWTLLEGIRGNRAIHVLCKNNNPVPLKYFLVALYERGSIDLCGVLLGSPHLLPMGQEISTIELEKAGTMLSRRFASRPGDEMIIWSLLCGDDTAEKRLECFWKGRLRVPIKSGFLMSTCDRVNGIRGLSWAPSSPFPRPMTLDISSPDPAIYASYVGNGTMAVKLLEEKVSDYNTALHLRGDWCVYIVQLSDYGELSPAPNSCWERAKQLLSSGEYKRVIFVRPVFSRAHVVAGDEIPFIGPWNLNEGEGPPVAVCATKDDRDTFDVYRLETELVHTNELWGEEWEWKGIYKEAPRNSIGGDKFQKRTLRIV